MENRCLNGQRFFFYRYREEQMEHRTGLESFYAVDEKNRKLRYGYTTGSVSYTHLTLPTIRLV